MDGRRRLASVADAARRLPPIGGGGMTSFLNRLLSTTLGDSGSGSAHVSLRPRFALTTAAPAVARPRDEPIEDSATGRSELPRSGTPPHASRRRRGTASRESPKETHPVESEPTLAAAPLISSPAAHSASRKNAPDPEIAPHQHISGPLTWSARDFLVAPSRASASSPFDAPAAMRTAVPPVLPVLQAFRLDS